MSLPIADAPNTTEQNRTLGVVDILSLYGLDSKLATRLVRHQDDRYPLDELRRDNYFELYQSYQRRPVFHGLDAIVSFYGLPGTRAAFYGVFRVRGHRPGRAGVVTEACPLSSEWHRNAQFFYELERDPDFDFLRDRLVIDWGAGTRSWVQKVTNKPVLSIEEPGRKLPLFDDYLGFSLSYAELTDLFAKEEAHRDWRASLTAVAGIYVILAESSGALYVGSAYGSEGIWGRWREYARSGHGNNELLRKLVARDPAYPGAFRFSILQTVPQTMTREEVIRRERLYKQKLGTRASGLNGN